MAKAQISMDLLFIAAVVLILFLFLFQIYLQRADSVRIFQSGLAAQRVADDIGRSIDHAWLGGNGSVSHASLPESLPNGMAYNVSLRGRQVLVLYPAGAGTRVASYITSTSSVTAINFTLAPLGGGKSLNVTNLNGSIVVVG